MTDKKQLIYKEDLIAEYDRVHIGEPGNARKLMEDAPTVDAVEVVHGRWTHDAVQTCVLFDDSFPVWVDVMQCSVCNEYIEGSHGTSYCPNCGAKMDGDGNA